MAYRITYGSGTIYDPSTSTGAAHGAKLGMKSDEVSTLTFTIPPTHSLASTIKVRDFDNPVRAYFDDTLLFCGFVNRITESIDRQLAISCESDIALLDGVHIVLSDHPDLLSDVYDFGLQAKDLFQYAIEIYNSRVPAARRFTIGHNLATNAVGYETSTGKHVDADTSSPKTVLALIADSILRPYGCVLRVWYSGSTRYIGLYTEAWETSQQVITFGENMTDYAFDTNDENLYTGCYMIGGTEYDYSESETIATFHLTRAIAADDVMTDIYLDAGPEYQFGGDDEILTGTIFVIGGLNFKSSGALVNNHMQAGPSPITIPSGTAVYYKGKSPKNSKSYTVDLKLIADGDHGGGVYYKQGGLIYHKAAVNRYGLRTWTETDSGITYPPRLAHKAMALISQRIGLTTTLSVNAVDMALYASNRTHLLAGQKVRVVSVPHAVDTTMRVTEASLDLDNPSATKYTLGALPNTVTRKVAAGRRRTDDVEKRLERYMCNRAQSNDLIGFR